MHNLELTVKRQNDTLLLCYRKAECECPLYFFVQTLWSLVGTRIHWCLWALPFWWPNPNLHLRPTAVPSRRPFQQLPPSGNSSLHLCWLPGKSTQALTHKSLFPLSCSQSLAKLEVFSACSSPLVVSDPLLLPAFFWVLLQRGSLSLALPHPGLSLDLTPAETAPCLPFWLHPTQERSLHWVRWPLNHHHL